MSLKLKRIDLSAKIRDKHEYEERLEVAQLQLLLLQRRIFDEKRSAILVFEGWDAAGKGGCIRRVLEKLDPRGFVVHPICAPTADEKAEHYLQRFWEKMPRPGCIDVFDRSWYGRVLVERVEHFCDKEDWQRAYQEINAFEKMLVDGGTPVLKFFLNISQKEQLKRFKEREKDPFKNWKITEEDWRNRNKWKKYEQAIDDMFKRTSTSEAAWHGISAERKWHGRVQVLELAVKQLSQFFGYETKLPKGWQTWVQHHA